MNAKPIAWQEHLSLVYVAARKFPSKVFAYVEWKDLYQVGQLTLWQCSQSFDPSKGFTFAGYAVRMMHWQMHRYIQQVGGTIRQPLCHRMNDWLDMAIRVQPVSLTDVIDNRPRPPELAALADEAAVLRGVIDKFLNPRLRSIICRRYSGETLEEVARILGITRARVRDLEFKAIFKLRKYLELDEYGNARPKKSRARRTKMKIWIMTYKNEPPTEVLELNRKEYLTLYPRHPIVMTAGEERIEIPVDPDEIACDGCNRDPEDRMYVLFPEDNPRTYCGACFDESWKEYCTPK